jgi:hypothetical protein
MFKGSKLKFKGSKLTFKGLKLLTLRENRTFSASVHFHHIVGISINYHRGENSMSVVILNENNSKH